MKVTPLFKNKYNLTRFQNSLLSKTMWQDIIYCGMKMENRNVTFPQMQTILNGVNVPGVTLDDIQAILNMRDAWRFLLSSIDEPVTLDWLCKINGFVARNEALKWGELRTGDVGISGTDYVPPIPVEDEVCEELYERILLSGSSVTEKAINAFLWGARRQLFWDGNKRSSLLLANKILVAGGHGILTIQEKHMETFNTLLSKYYDTGSQQVIKEFLYQSAIHGIDFVKHHEHKSNGFER